MRERNEECVRHDKRLGKRSKEDYNVAIEIACKAC